MNLRALLVVSLVVVLVVATTWLSETTEKPTLEPEEAAALTDYFLRDFEATVTGANGRPSHHITSDSLTHFAGNGVAELVNPRLTVYRPRGENWRAEAEQGRMEGDGKQVTLRGKVILKQQSGTRPMQLSTDLLHLSPDDQYGETDAPVTISSPGGRLSGVGMKVYGQENRLLLLSDVRGRYDSTAR
jgi:lipopolysaccharide export system protein LptC